jgi:hypothetical protein
MVLMRLHYAILAMQEASTETAQTLVKTVTFVTCDTCSTIEKVPVAIMTEKFVQEALTQRQPFEQLGL